MKINYPYWAKIIRIFLMLGIIAQLSGFLISIIKDVFQLNNDFSLSGIDYGYRDFEKGYPVKAGLWLEIPDTVYRYVDGNMDKNTYGYQWKTKEKLQAPDTIINEFEHGIKLSMTEERQKLIENGHALDNIANQVGIPGKAIISIKTNNITHRLFFILNNYWQLFFYTLISLGLIRLINRYLKGDFLHSESFRQINRIGIWFIWMNVIEVLFNILLTYILPDFNFVSRIENSQQFMNTVKMYVHSNISFDITYLLIGGAILVLSDIIKDAVLIKRENELTI